MKILSLKKNKIYLFLYSLLLFIIGTGLGSLFSGVSETGNPSTPVPQTTPEGGRNIEVEQFTFETNYGKDRKYKIYADSVDMNEQQKIARLNGVRCYFYEKKIEAFTVEAGSADMDIKTKVINFKDKVFARALSGEMLEADNLYWKSNEKLSVGEGNIKLAQGVNLAEADRMKGDINFDAYTMDENVVLLVKLKGKEGK
ncbi:MAG: LPS export ABC transporter periplasmic protein LptC [Candidatus Eremiobacterota bacterium]